MKSFNQIGDEFKFSIQSFINGNINVLDAFLENIEGETATRKLDRKFRYSYDGVNYSQYMEFNEANLATVNGYIDYILFLDFVYTRIGTDNSGVIIFNSLEITGDVILQINNYESTIGSIFSGILERNFYTESVRVNLLRKVYNSGIIPEFIERGENYDDADYISFWGTICKFFALTLTFAEEFDNLIYVEDKLFEYLRQQNVGLNKNLTLSDLQILAKNFLSNLRKRGTILPTLKKGTILKDGSEIKIDGEWLRIINFDENDEFIAQFERLENNSFFLDKSSSVYGGNYNDTQINKVNDKIKEDILSVYVQPSYWGNLINVDPHMDYSFNFTIKRKQLSNITSFSDILVGMYGFNEHGYQINRAFISAFTQNSNNYFLDSRILNITKVSEVDYRISCVLFNYKYAFNYKNILNINKGSNLKFASNKIKKVLPFINIGGTNLEVSNVNFRPLVKGLRIDKIKNPSFLQSVKFVNNYRKNNNDNRDEKMVNDFISQYLLPYNYLLNNIEIEQ